MYSRNVYRADDMARARNVHEAMEEFKALYQNSTRNDSFSAVFELGFLRKKSLEFELFIDKKQFIDSLSKPDLDFYFEIRMYDSFGDKMVFYKRIACKELFWREKLQEIEKAVEDALDYLDGIRREMRKLGFGMSSKGMEFHLPKEKESYVYRFERPIIKHYRDERRKNLSWTAKFLLKEDDFVESVIENEKRYLDAIGQERFQKLPENLRNILVELG